MQTDPLTLGIVTGVISSLIAAALIKFVAVMIWKTKVPGSWMEYDGIHLEGSWKNEIVTTTDRWNKANLTLKQRGKWLRGEMNLHAEDGKSDDDTSYRIRGRIVNGYVKFDAWPKEKGAFGFSSGIFHIEGNGKTLRGSSVFIDNFTSVVDTHDDFTWTKLVKTKNSAKHAVATSN